MFLKMYLQIAVTCTLVLISAAVVPVRTQQPADASARFEVTSVRRNTSVADVGSVGAQRGGRLVAVSATPLQIIAWAFRMEATRIVGAPGWAAQDRYDVAAAPAQDLAGQLGFPAVQQMTQHLMTDRFKLTTHNEMRPLPVYTLAVARTDRRLGPQIQKATVDCAALQKEGLPPSPAPRTAADFEKPPTCGVRGGSGLYAAGGVTLTDFSQMLRSSLDAPVVDKTGLEGAYTILLKWTPDGRSPTTDQSSPALFTAVEEQLGLKLQRGTELLEVLVIDSISRPSEN